MSERIIYLRGDRVQWKVDFDSDAAMIDVHHHIKGSAGAHLGVQLPERRMVVFYSDEVEPVYFQGEELMFYAFA